MTYYLAHTPEFHFLTSLEFESPWSRCCQEWFWSLLCKYMLWCPSEGLDSCWKNASYVVLLSPEDNIFNSITTAPLDHALIHEDGGNRSRKQGSKLLWVQMKTALWLHIAKCRKCCQPKKDCNRWPAGTSNTSVASLKTLSPNTVTSWGPGS